MSLPRTQLQAISDISDISRPGVPASRRPGAPAVGDGLGGIAAVAPRAARHVGAEPSGIPRHVAGETVETAWDMATRLGCGLDVGNGEMGNILKPGSVAAAIPICAICLPLESTPLLGPLHAFT